MRPTLLVLLAASACKGDAHDVRPGSGVGPGSGLPGDSGTTPVTGSVVTVPERRHDCSGMDPADRGPLGGKVALTFDDGPSATVTPQVLDTLRAYGVPATFFMLGTELSDPAVWPLVDEMVADPLFELGNHSYFHPDMSLLSAQEIRAEIDDTDFLLRSFGVTPRYFRFPYGQGTCEAADIVRDEFGYHVTGWHSDTADWCYSPDNHCTPSDYWRITPGLEDDNLAYLMSQIRAFDGGVVLAHDIHQYTADSLATAIEAVLAEGFTFTRLDDVSTFPRLNQDDPFDFPWMGEACDTSDDLCWQVEWLSHYEPTGAPDATAGICVLPCGGSLLCFDRDGVAPIACVDHDSEGACIAQSHELNAFCDAAPGAAESDEPLFGSSQLETVCWPEAW